MPYWLNRLTLALGFVGFAVAMIALIVWHFDGQRPVWIWVMVGGAGALFISYVMAIGAFIWDGIRLRRLGKELTRLRSRVEDAERRYHHEEN